MDLLHFRLLRLGSALTLYARLGAPSQLSAKKILADFLNRSLAHFHPAVRQPRFGRLQLNSSQMLLESVCVSTRQAMSGKGTAPRKVTEGDLHCASSGPPKHSASSTLRHLQRRALDIQVTVMGAPHDIAASVLLNRF
jgi:hypothetical protein